MNTDVKLTDDTANISETWQVTTHNSYNAIIESQPEKSKSDAFELLGIPLTNVSAVTSSLTAIFSLALTFATIIKYAKDNKHQVALFKSQKRKEEIKEAKEKIEKFYGPFNSLLEESRVIYNHFAKDEKKELKEKGDYFRTLRFLTEETGSITGVDRLKPHDQELFKHIVDISDKINNLIEIHGGCVENPALHILLGNLAAHYKIIKSAYEGKLENQSENLEDIVFPLEINGAIHSEINKLLRIIRVSEDKKNKVTNNKSIDFYNKNHILYSNQTKQVCMKSIYDKVRIHIENGSTILDAGCGVGRDTEYFIKHGFKVISFDASLRMVEMCSEYPFAFCEHRSFSTINYPQIFDLVWACASLLHLNENYFKKAISNLFSCLRKDGYLYFSLKKIPQSHISKDQREYYFYDQEFIDNLLCKTYSMSKVDVWETPSNLNSSDIFINYIYKK